MGGDRRNVYNLKGIFCPTTLIFLFLVFFPASPPNQLNKQKHTKCHSGFLLHRCEHEVTVKKGREDVRPLKHLCLGSTQSLLPRHSAPKCWRGFSYVRWGTGNSQSGAVVRLCLVQRSSRAGGTHLGPCRSSRAVDVTVMHESFWINYALLRSDAKLHVSFFLYLIF